MLEIQQLNQTTFEVEMSSGDKVEIGNKEAVDFKPHLKLNRWGGECFVKVGLPTTKRIKPVIEDDKAKWGEPNLEAHLYPLEPRAVIAKDKDGRDVPFIQNELGGFEFEIILRKKPKTNQIVLDIETQGLKFYYQPELTPEEIIEGCIRPDNVVGSYAVYHATRTNMHRSEADAEKYKCGIAFHIYRPKITDAMGNWVWGELSIDEKAGTLTTAIPQDFLDGAVYPVSIDPNFGYEIKGGTSYTYIKDFRTLALTLPAEGIVSSLTAYIYAQNASALWAFGVYTGANNASPIYRVDYSAEGGGVFNNWSTLSAQIGYSLEGGAGHLAIHCNEVTPNTVGYYNAGATNEMWAGSTTPAYSYPLSESRSRFNNYARKESIYGTYTTAVAPTVTAQAASSVEDTTATTNGNITDNGGEDCDKRGVVYDTETHADPGDVAPGASGYANFAEDTDGFGTGAFTKAISSLPPGTTIYYRMYAHNSEGYDYSNTEITFLTKPAAPTNVAATDGDHTDKVVVTWTKSTGATGYKVYEGVNLLDTLGDVATYDDMAAPAPTITPGAAAASDGTSSDHVTLSLSGESANNGSSRTYKVVAFNATGDSDDSDTDTGYRGVGALTYQWQRSAADSDADYSNIDGATTDPYNDTGAPENGDGRYYRCVENATGASQQISSVDRGFRAVHYDRSGTALLGVKGTASRVRVAVRSDTSPLGLLSTGVRVGVLTRSDIALFGLKGIASRVVVLVRADDTLLGLKTTATRAIAFTPQSATALLGLLPTGSRVLALIRTNTALLGLKGIATRVIVLTRADTALLGLKTTGVKFYSYVFSAIAYLGVKTTGVRTLTLTRAKTTLLGLLASGSRVIVVTRADTVLLGLLTTGVRIISYARTNTALLGLKGTATRIIKLVRGATAILGYVPTGEGLIHYVRMATAYLGLKTTGVRTVVLSRVDTALLGLKGTATRVLVLSRADDTLLGLKSTGARVVVYIRTNTTLLGLKTTGIRVLEEVHKYVRTGVASLGLKATGVRTIVLTRASTAFLGLKGTATRVLALTRADSALAGLKATATRVMVLTRADIALLGLKTTGVWGRFYERSATALLGLTTTGAWGKHVTRAATALLELKTTGVRVISRIRADTALLGLITTAKRLAYKIKSIPITIHGHDKELDLTTSSRHLIVTSPKKDFTTTKEE